MGTRINIINEHWKKQLLLRENTDFNKFYKEELVDFCEIARKLLIEQREEINKTEQRCQ